MNRTVMTGKGTAQDLTGVETIYRKRVRTVTLKLDHREGANDRRRVPIRRPGDLRKVLRGIYAGLDDDQDHVLLLILNIGNEITGFKVVASGAQDHVAVDLRIIFRHALLGAARIIIVHNHPSGNPAPSRFDREGAAQLIEAGRLLGVVCLDHVMDTGGRYTSMRELCDDLAWDAV